MPRTQFQTLTESMYYILLSLDVPRYGYEIMQTVDALTSGRVQLGAGTLYALLPRFEQEQMIQQIEVVDRKKIYALTQTGRDALTAEFHRLETLVSDGRRMMGHEEG